MNRLQWPKMVIRHPFVIVIPIVLALWLGWNYYVQASSGVLVAATSANLLPGGAFEDLSNLPPTGWRVTKSNSATDYFVRNTRGLVGGAMELQIMRYQTGDLTVQTPLVTLQTHKMYLYKGYYRTTAKFDLLMRSFYHNGSQQLSLVAQYTDNNGQWTTASHAFTSTNELRAVQFEYRLASSDTLTLDDTTLQETTEMYVPPTRTMNTKNRIHNADFATATATAVPQWTPYHSGTATVALKPMQENHNWFARTGVSNYQSGEAKWVHQALPVAANDALQFAVDYRSTAPSEVIAEYTLATGQRKFTTLKTLLPAGDWTHMTAILEAPHAATSVTVGIVLRQNGTLDTDSYQLSLTTQPGAREFTSPLVSVTFDDGRQTDFSSIASMLETYNMRGTFYINPLSLDTTGYMTTVQAQQLYKRGHQIGSHSLSHTDLTTITNKKVDTELRRSLDVISAVTGESAVDFAAPFGRSDANVSYITRRYYRSQRSLEPGLNTRHNFDPYGLRVLFIGSDTPVQTVQAALAEAKAYNAWLILLYHPYGTSPVEIPYDTAPLRSYLAAIQQSGIPVTTVRSALNQLEDQR